MQHRIVWVHGIGPHRAGYSQGWQSSFNQHLQLAPENYHEVCWDTVFQAAGSGTRGIEDADPGVAMTAEEERAEEETRAELETLLLARLTAMEAAEDADTRGVDAGIVEWQDVYEAAGSRGALDWVFDPDEYLGDFARYLVSRNVRNAVKEKAKEVLRPLAGTGIRVSIIAHSWGTVVSYDSLLDLQAEVPTLKIANLITLGSPLWMVRRFLDNRTGIKPSQTASWLNIHARGDLIGSWLSRSFRVDREWQVPNFGQAGAHSSYFVAGNLAVQRDLIAQYILGG